MNHVILLSPECHGSTHGIPTILIINDSVDYPTNLAEVLSFENYHIQEAENGLYGLQMIRRFLPDLIICDVDMCAMNGIDVLKTVKTDATHAKIPFIVVIGHNDRLTIKTLFDLGADNCLRKPATNSELLRTVGNFL